VSEAAGTLLKTESTVLEAERTALQPQLPTAAVIRNSSNVSRPIDTWTYVERVSIRLRNDENEPTWFLTADPAYLSDRQTDRQTERPPWTVLHDRSAI
jgi:hypothetical protein